MGFAQKFGPVLSYLRIAEQPSDINQVRIDPARADGLIGCDIVVSSSPKASITYQRDHTRALINTAEMLTGDFVQDRDASLRASDRVAAISAAIGEQNLHTIDANRLAERLMGDTIYSNVIMVGCAWQQGLIPVSLAALLRAIELNGIKIEENKQAFTWGRIAAHNAAAIERILDGSSHEVETLDRMVERRQAFLNDYQDKALADRYVALVNRAREAESAVSDDNKLATAIAKSYFRLLSYKDEYEVARLHTDENFLAGLRRDYGDRAKLRFHLAPPILNGKRDARGRPLKKEFGAWILPLFRLLASLKKLRGTAFDIFGYTAERRMERQLIATFEDTVEDILLHLEPNTIEQACGHIGAYLDIRGYGPVKEEAVRKVLAKEE